VKGKIISVERGEALANKVPSMDEERQKEMLIDFETVFRKWNP
jgi:hypothetical protein